MKAVEFKNDDEEVLGLSEKQLNVLKAYDIIYLVVFTFIALVAIHNMLRYIKRVISPANKFMLGTFYASVVLMSACTISGSSLNLRYPGEIIQEICNLQHHGSKHGCLILEVAEMVVIQIELYTIIYTMH